MAHSVIQSFKKQYETHKTYDSIIIGSGLGSLTTAAILVKEGHTVLILEKHYTPGGFTHVFKRREYEWDVGIHYVGEMQRENSLMKKIFDYITDSKLEWADMGEVYDKIVIGEKEYDFVKGTKNFKAKLNEYFPEETEAIDTYVSMVFQCNKAAKKFYLEKAMPPVIAKLSGDWFRKKFKQYADKTTDEVLRSLTSNEELIKVLSGQYGDYGLPPKQSSFAMQAAVARHYFSGGSFPVGGSARIVETIAPILSTTDSHLLTNAPVGEILIQNNTAIGIKMEDGTVFKSKRVISGAGIINTYRHMLPATVFEKYNLGSQLNKVTPSVSHACLYIGLKGSPEELSLPKTNYWLYPKSGKHDDNMDDYLKDNNNPFPMVYISFPASKDPSWNARYPGRSTIDIITLLPYEAVAQWEDSRWKKRGESYDAFKEKISQRLLEHLFKVMPQVKDKIDIYELSTPLTTKHFVNYDKGEIYGLDHTPKRFSNKFLRVHTPVKNLFLTGQDIVTAGIGAVLLSGVLTATAITKKNLLNKIMS